MELKDLQGKHILTGVWTGSNTISKEYYEGEVAGETEDVNCIYFVLDNITYCAEEDAEDGYRSCMRELKKVKIKNKNPIPKTDVLAIYSAVDSGDPQDILKLVMTVGTDNVDDYYPSYVSSWIPENLSINECIKGEK
jgi:hypothetical protein